MASLGYQVTLRVRIAWWLRWYLLGVALTSRLTGLPPDLDKASRWIRKAIRVDAIEGRRRRLRFW
ncbi:hypothetical protein CAL29_28130 [Bordetella genomosp. 10]|uniref:Uncharacterized protein n=1 Tax=Bordetella genomosp. 10 TaxID=1416804 RepID=A0A261S5N3_9BORD|nr:hypothetical protein CAL29_28130 [Bordetella genomosp. 10]